MVHHTISDPPIWTDSRSKTPPAVFLKGNIYIKNRKGCITKPTTFHAALL